VVLLDAVCKKGGEGFGFHFGWLEEVDLGRGDWWYAMGLSFRDIAVIEEISTYTYYSTLSITTSGGTIKGRELRSHTAMTVSSKLRKCNSL
jgi:hypothetical protein